MYLLIFAMRNYMSRKLSTDIRRLMKHCHICKGKGYRTDQVKDMKTHCWNCSDWNVALKRVIKLEKELKQYENRNI